jgi:transcriptional regulator with XRE-family HTH domain
MSTHEPTQEENDRSSARARFLVPRCAALRAGKGLKKAHLAALAKVDTSTLTKIERQQPVTIETAMLVFNQLQLQYAETLNINNEVVDTSLRPASEAS